MFVLWDQLSEIASSQLMHPRGTTGHVGRRLPLYKEGKNR